MEKLNDERLKNIFSIFCLLIPCLFYEFILKIFRSASLSGDYGDGAYSVMFNAFKGFAENKINFWLPNLWGGVPAVGNTLVQSLYPLNWLAVKLNGNDVNLLVMAFIHCLHLFLLCLGLFIFLRILKFSRKISLLSVITLVFSCEIPLQSLWIYLFTGFAWFPLIVDSLLLIQKDIKKKWLYILLGGIALGMSGLANQAQALLINILIICAFWGSYVSCNFKNRNLVLSYTKSVVSLGILGLFLCAPALFPAIEFTKNAVRYVPYLGWLHSNEKISLNEFNRYSIGADSLGSLLGYHFTSLNGYYSFFYFPFIASVFCIIGIFVKKQHKLVKRFCQGLLSFCLCYSIGFVFPLIFHYIPYFNGIREPFLYIPYIILPLAYFFAVGVRNLKKNLCDFKQSVYNPSTVAVLLLLVFISVLLPHNFKHYLFKQNFPIACFLILAIILYFFFIKYKKQIFKYVSAVLILACVVLQIKLTFCMLQGSYRFSSMSENVKQVEKCIGNLESVKLSKENHSRHKHWTDDRFYPSNIMADIGALDNSGYMNPIPRQAYLAQKLMHKQASLLQNVEFFHTQTNPEKIHYQQLEQSGIPFFKEEIACSDLGDKTKTSRAATWRAETLGNAWFVYNWQKVKDITELTDEEILGALNSRSDYKNFAFVNGLNDFSNHGTMTYDNCVELQEYNNDSVKLKIYTNKDGLLCTSELFYPGWSVYIDGKKSDCLQVNYLFRGVKISTGEHIIEFKFLPKTFILGVVLFFCALLFIFIFFIKAAVCKGNRK